MLENTTASVATASNWFMLVFYSDAAAWMVWEKGIPYTIHQFLKLVISFVFFKNFCQVSGLAIFIKISK